MSEVCAQDVLDAKRKALRKIGNIKGWSKERKEKEMRKLNREFHIEILDGWLTAGLKPASVIAKLKADLVAKYPE